MDRNDEDKLALASIKDCMESSTLHALCILGEIGTAYKVENATDSMVEEWFKRASSSTPKDLAERIDSALVSITYRHNNNDSAGSVPNFIIELIKSLDRNNASEVLQEADMAKHFIDRLVKKFEPPILQERIRMLRKAWKKEQLSNLKLFMNEVSNLAVEVALTETARKRLPRGETRDGARHTRYGERSRNESKAKAGPAGKKTEKRKESDWTDNFLNPDCNEIHRLKDCKMTTPERKKDLYEEFYKQKKYKRAKTVKFGETYTPSVEEGRYRVALEDIILETVLGHSGADSSAL